MYIILPSVRRGLNQYRPLNTARNNPVKLVEDLNTQPKLGGITEVAQELTPQQDTVGGSIRGLQNVQRRLKQVEIKNPERKLKKFIELKL